MGSVTYTKEQAQELANGLTMAVYWDKGVIRQHPPGERIEPRREALPIEWHGNRKTEET